MGPSGRSVVRRGCVLRLPYSVEFKRRDYNDACFLIILSLSTTATARLPPAQTQSCNWPPQPCQQDGNCPRCGAS